MIPKTIHYCWFGGNPLPEQAQRCIESWKKYCPDFEIIEWNESNIDVSSVDYMREAYEEKAWSFVSDVARLLIIRDNGGIYFDTDVEVIRPLDDLLANKAFAGIEDGEVNFINSGLGFGAEKNSDFVAAMLSAYENRHFRKADGTLDKTACPSLLIGLMHELGFNGIDENQTVSDAAIYASRYFCPQNYETGILTLTDDTYTIHHFYGSWVSKREKIWRNFYYAVIRKFGLEKGKRILSSLPLRMLETLIRGGIAFAFERLKIKIKELNK